MEREDLIRKLTQFVESKTIEDVKNSWVSAKNILDVLCVKYNKINIPMFYEEWQAKLEENAQLKKQINHLLKTQARQFVDNQKLQVKAEKAKDVVNIDTARQIKQLKELLKECKGIFDECFSPSAKHGELYKKIDEELNK